MKKILSGLLIIGTLLPFITTYVYSSDNSGYLVVTAYYSPLPDQDYYLTGNYSSEKRLNGEGIAGASGKGVFSGMLAAPKNYRFGTKIYLEGLGVGEVSDRGGAIVNAGNRGYASDRIDVWVGYGDEGLRRALYWGKRKIKGNIISTNSNVTLNYKSISAPLWVTKGLKKIPSIFNTGVGIKSDALLIKKVQKFLSDIFVYDGEITGIYNNDVIDTVYDFQIDNGLIQEGDYYGAGYWGKATRALYLKKYLNGEFDKADETIEVITEEIVDIIENTNLYIFDTAVSGVENVKVLQGILKELYLYKGELTGSSNDIIDSIYDYQLSEGIVTSIYSPGAGNFGPKTRDALKETYTRFLQGEQEDSLAEIEAEKKRQEQLKLEEEKRIEEERKKDLEEKFNHLEELALKKAEEKMSFIGTPKFGEISHGVRELQVTLKELGYFSYNDTAIYGNITKQSIIAFQIDNNIIASSSDLGAGLVGPKTRAVLKDTLKYQFLQQIAKTKEYDIDELASIGDNEV